MRARLALAGLLPFLAACSHSPSTSTAAPACQEPSPGHGPQLIAATLSDADANGTFCLTRGKTIAVYLHVDPGGQASRWDPPASSDAKTLKAVPSGMLTTPIGVTAGFFSAARDGTAAITSRRANGATWRATVVVRG